MSNPSHLISVAFNPPNLRRKSIRRRAYVGLLVAATSATVLWSGGAAIAGRAPCKSHGSRDKSGTRHPVRRTAQLLHSPLRGSFITSRRPIQCKTPSATPVWPPPRPSTDCARPMSMVTLSLAPRPWTKRSSTGSFPR